MTLQEEYQVKLDAFCGPLDLLLYLIRRAEVDIHDIPIANITEQYLQMLRVVDYVDIEAAGEFLVMAATLMEIKSRTLMPPEAQGLGEDGEPIIPGQEIEISPGTKADPRFELVRQLLEYQRYRLAAEDLQLQRRAFSQQFVGQPFHDQPEEVDPEPPVLELDDAHVYDLFDAYERIVAAIDFTRFGDHRVEIDDTPAVVYQEDLLERLRRAEGRLSLQEMFEGHDRLQRLGLFLAMLELVRLRRIVVKQEDLLSDIAVELSDEEPESQEPAEPT
jgi:segregation and condensation protein A